MNATIQNALAWPYSHPLFSRGDIENTGGTVGLAKAAANLAVWSAGVGLVAKLAGIKHPWRIAGGTFAVLVVADLIFGHSQINSGGGPGTAYNPITTATASPFQSINGTAPSFGGGGYSDNEGGYGQGDGYDS